MLDPVRNFAIATVSTGYAAGVTTITLSAGNGSKFPPTSEGEYNLVWWNSSDYANPALDPYVEIVRCINREGDVLTIIRGQEGTNDVNHNIDGKVYRVILAMTAKTINDINKVIPIYDNILGCYLMEVI